MPGFTSLKNDVTDVNIIPEFYGTCTQNFGNFNLALPQFVTKDKFEIYETQTSKMKIIKLSESKFTIKSLYQGNQIQMISPKYDEIEKQ